MKKLILSVCLVMTVLFVYSQPTLYSNEMLGPGSVMNMKTSTSFSVYDTTITGANATWNFAALSPGTNFTLAIANPANTPYSGFFPSTNYAYVENGGSAYRYFDLTTAKMERVGSYVSSVNSYSDPQVEYIYPLMLGAFNNDTWDNTNSSFGGTYNLVCIGYGTLILPTATYNDALMVRVEIDETLYNIQVYFWYSSDNGAILLEYTEGDGTFINPFSMYLNSLTVGNEEQTLISGIRYNNPVSDLFHLNFTGLETQELKYTVMNAMGQTINDGGLTVNK